mmetsp:Transcript_35058/g.34084  ORF Transcript_35058/g.34084 Transcript_35058/m.34084 type:complete len:106 (-) Transcript_35058:119-436(-)|eukprot:CAMPEP_0170549180 /NCGR_PEP_ID=MMETSP0211-20121228/7382_1 /TAXON_ID=311385 /ORGANISM="Pseudokeronopsis sp., Strain OXSARD2" /LENGTH=105 /DNA_ID=CAMNT_0010855075 /DNA_START=918 /DNA_END=1235 /DNA_ORIENTATION=-
MMPRDNKMFFISEAHNLDDQEKDIKKKGTIYSVFNTPIVNEKTGKEKKKLSLKKTRTLHPKQIHLKSELKDRKLSSASINVKMNLMKKEIILQNEDDYEKNMQYF